MALNDILIRAAKPREKDWKLADERGLYLLITPKGSKLWRVKFRVNGKEKKLSLGAYPDVSLKDARRMRDQARSAKAHGIDPAKEKQQAKQAAKLGAENSFAVVAEEYIEKMVKEGLAEATISKARWFLELLRPSVGRMPIADIQPQDLFAALKKIEKAGHRETAKRLRSFSSRVFRYAVATARATADPAQTLRGALASPIVKHYAAITDPLALGELMRAIDGYSGEPATMAALRLTPHVFQRPGEVRQMRWSEVDLEKGIWTIPAERMKQRHTHAVPLSRQSVAILTGMQGLTGNGMFVFPSVRTRERPMSENTVNGALRRLGYSGSEMTAHGFRSTASTLLNESGKWNPDAIERALSHAEKNQVRAAYNRGSYWNERVEMAQWWSDYLNTLKDGATVIPIARAIDRLS
jgi:integrase